MKVPTERSFYGIAELDATKQEIAELSRVMADFESGLTDVAENRPSRTELWKHADR